MVREVENPTVEEESGPCGGKRFRHPAYAMISASSISGHAVLYGSDFQHMNTVRITISSSSLRRDLCTDWPSAERELIEVELSESQWASFVSSVSRGRGVQCTMRYKDGKMLPALPDPQDRTEQFSSEVTGYMRDSRKEIDKAIEMLAASGLSKKKQDEIVSQLNMAKRDIGSSLKFVADQFGEHMETTVEKAKTEIEAFANNTVMRFGLEAIASGNATLQLIHNPKKDADSVDI